MTNPRRPRPARPKSPARRRRALVVLGMHRSGTSALTRVLSLLGADLPGRLMKAGRDNERGYWEPEELVSIHDRLLAAAGRSWDAVLPVPEDFWRSPVADAFGREIRDALGRAFASSPVFVVKDPRICRLLPLWRPALEAVSADPSFVLCARNPLEVADSLQVRNGYAPGRSILLWLRHVIDAERGSRDHPRTVVSYEGLVADWRAVVARLRRDLGFPESDPSPEAAAAIDGFLEGALRHESRSLEELRTRRDLPPGTRAAYEAMVAAEQSGPRGLAEAFDPLAREIADAERWYGPVVDELAGQLRHATALLETVRGEWAAAAAERDRLRSEGRPARGESRGRSAPGKKATPARPRRKG